jgi:ADP-ribose diphosphatase
MNDAMWANDEWFALKKDQRGEAYIRPRGDEVLVVPLTADGQIILSTEPSAAFGEPVLLLSGGSTEVGEDHETTANREMQEEIGYQAGRLDYLGEVRPWSKYLQLTSYIYLARDLTPRRLVGDEAYEIGTERVSLADLETLIAQRRLLDARAIAGLYLLRTFLEREGQQP